MQGADLIQIKPILCVANCEPIAGGSTLWLSIGIITTVLSDGWLANYFGGLSNMDKFENPEVAKVFNGYPKHMRKK